MVFCHNGTEGSTRAEGWHGGEYSHVFSIFVVRFYLGFEKKRLKYNRTFTPVSSITQFKPRSEYFFGGWGVGERFRLQTQGVRFRNFSRHSPNNIWAYSIIAQHYNLTKDKANIVNPKSHED